MAKDKIKFDEAIKLNKIPILSIDKKYHVLKNSVGTTEAIEKLENELNELLKIQGKANTEIKEVKKLKKKLMQEIVDNTDENSALSEEEKEKKADENSRLISECNEKIEQFEDDIMDMPKMIAAKNKELMMELMDNCYDVLKDNEIQIQATAKWINEVRIELKKRLIKKTDMEGANQQIYSYMHDIFGAEVIELFDMTYKDTTIK